MKKNRSVEFGFIGLGQAGGRIAAEATHLYQYQSIAINSTNTDLEKLEISPKKKLLLQYGLEGAGKNLSFGRRAVEENRDVILDFMRLHMTDGVEYSIGCYGNGGGSGGGGIVPLISIMRQSELPIGLICTLPLESEDTIAKQNCVRTLKQLDAIDDISPIIIVDNEKISKKYPNLSISQFWKRANHDVIQTFHLFNMISSLNSEIHSYDMADHQMVLRAGGCMTMGKAQIEGHHSKEVLAENAKNAISTGLLADGFDLTTARRVGIILRATKKVLDRMKATDLDYIFNYIRDVIQAGGIYRGVYSMEGQDERIQIYSIFGGLDFPRERLGQLIDETRREVEIVSQKKKRSLDGDDPFNTDALFDDQTDDDPLLDFIKKKTTKKKDGFWR